jgi:imidazolonepropionase-like amidohydrolase
VSTGIAIAGIRGVRVVDVARGVAGPPTAVRIANGSIEAIGPGTAGVFDALDGRGRFLAPGLIDAHVHLVWRGDGDPVGSYQAAPVEERLAIARANAEAALAAGITTLRDLGGPSELLPTAARWTGTADVVASGPPITRPGGHLGLFGGECRLPDEARSVVRAAAAAGARAIKVVLSGGGLTPGTRPASLELPADVARAAVDEAHSSALRVAAHCHATGAIELALDLGVDTIEHASFLETDGRPGLAERLVRRVADSGTAIVPTAAGALRTAALLRATGRVAADDPFAVERLEARAAFVARYAEIGATIVAGTDAGVTDTGFGALHDELDAYGRVGIAAAAALRAATVDAARALGLTDRGEVRVGSRADLLLLDRDPTSDLATLRAPVAVISAGRVIR